LFWQLCALIHAVDLFIIWISVFIKLVFVGSHLIVLVFIIVSMVIVFLLMVALRARVGPVGLISLFLFFLVEQLHEIVDEIAGVECSAVDGLMNNDLTVFELGLMFALDIVVAELSEEDQFWV
jgi:hypothetical protein